MNPEDLFDYIKKATATGMSEGQIVESLKNAGWNEGDVRKALEAFPKKDGKDGGNASSPAPTQPARPSGGTPTVLIVDDEANFIEIFSAKLQAVGFKTIGAKNGKEALAVAEKSLPNLILMDIHLGNETGTDVALSLKQNPKTQNIKIAFLTNLKEPWPAISGDRDKVAKELGMEDFLEKTDDLNNLVKRIQAIIAAST